MHVDNHSCATSKILDRCQICGSPDLQSIVFFGYIPPVNTMPAIGQPATEQSAYPLELLRCPVCSLVQIGLEVDQKVLFPYSYPYLSGSTGILRQNFADLHRECRELGLVAGNDLVVDIGSNDGTLLGNFLEGGLRVLGVEPSQAGEKARARGIDTLTAYFNPETAKSVKEKYGQAKLITAANVFAHIGNIDQVIEGILELLAPDGVFVNESHYLLDLVKTLQYDTIYHEHLRHYSLESLAYLFACHGLEIFHTKRIPSHGGSIRVYAARKGQRPALDSVATLRKEEAEAGLTDGSALVDFRNRVVESKLELMSLLRDLKAADARIYGVGAPSRASTLINYTGLDDGILDCVLEISTSHKLGKYVPGTRIPVLDENKLFEDQPEYALLLSWHIADELVGNLRRKGYRGKFLVPLPRPAIVD